MSNQQLLLDAKDRVDIALVDLYFSIFKQLHGLSVKYIQKYVAQPLRHNYENIYHDEVKNLTAALEYHRKQHDFHAMGVLYKKMLQQVTYRGAHREIFKIISRLLLDAETFEKFRNSKFFAEFISIFRESFYDFEQERIADLNQDFERSINDDDIKASKKLINKAEQQNDEALHKANLQAEELFKKIERAYVMQDLERLTYNIAQFTGRFCNFPNIAHREDVDKIIEDLTENNPTIRLEITNRLAVKIFHEIVRSMNKKDFKNVIRAIATFAITFQNNLQVPYRKELDALEEKLYAFIEKKNLWSQLNL